MKKLASLFLIVCCFFVGINASAAMILEYDGSVHNYTGSIYTLTVNGKELKDLPLEPIIFSDRAFVPAREVFEALGATVKYIADTKTIKISYDDTVVEIQINSNCAFINGKTVRIPDDITPRLIAKWGESAKTMIPLRFVSESLGLVVNFDGAKGNISVSKKTVQPPQQPTVQDPPKPSNQNTITKVSIAENDDVVTITVTAKNNILKMTDAVVTGSGVLYVDVPNMTYTASNRIEGPEGSVVKSVRLGLHDSDTRIAIDTQNMKKHSEKISGKSIVFVITANASADVSQNPSISVTTPTPEVNTQTNTNIPLVNGKTPSEISNGVKYVVLDAGHGGSDPGAIGNLMTDSESDAYHENSKASDFQIDKAEAGTKGKINEKDIALKVILKVKEKLEKANVKVILTRSGDTYPTLDERATIANNQGAAMFLSVHLNSTVNPVTTANGMEIYYCESNNGTAYGVTSKSMATTILKNVVSESKAVSRGVKSGNLLVTRKTVMPANLIEIGFINNPDELAKLVTDSYQEKIASGIAKGILEVLGKITLP